MKLADIIAAIPELTPAEHKALKLALDSFTTPEGVVDTQYIDMEILDAIQAVTGERIALVPFKASKSYKLFVNGQGVFRDLISKLAGESHPLPKVKRLALKRFLIGLIVDGLKEKTVPVTMLNICLNMLHIERILNEQFPGYLNNGLGGVILNKVLGGDK